jgi:adenylyltransferase/sulfurtransferase
MDGINRAVEVLRARIGTAEKELADLRVQLAQAEKQAQDASTSHVSKGEWKWPLEAAEYERYGRQMILPDFGVEGESSIDLFRHGLQLNQPFRSKAAQVL